MGIKVPVTPSFTVTTFMLRDHAALNDLMEKYRRMKKTGRESARGAFFDYKRHSERHMAWEEEILFPLFEERTGLALFGPTRAMRIEHLQIHALLEHLWDVVARGESRAEEMEESLIEKRLLDIVKVHKEKEEQILYPWFDTAFRESEKEDLIGKMEENLPAPLTP